jgi:molybdopterin-guanine dinucleotide biosynthesis protein A
MGEPKAWLPFGDEVMLQRVVRVVKEAVDFVMVVAAPDKDIPNLPPDVLVVRDDLEGRGPLQGLASGLKALEGRVDCVYLSSCDVPFLRHEFVKRVISLIKGVTPTMPREIAIPKVEDRFHPLAAAYSITVLSQVQQLLDANRLRLLDLMEMLPTRVIEDRELADVDPEFESLRNINTREDYESALQVLRTRQQP